MEFTKKYINQVSHKNWKYNEYGVPILSNEQIENIAITLLENYSKPCIYKPSSTPIENIINEFCDKYKFKLIFEELPEFEGKNILGFTYYEEKYISINKKLQENNMNNILRMTLAHELGHCILHRHRPIYSINKQKEDLEKELIKKIDDDEEKIDLFTNVKNEINKQNAKKTFTDSIDWVEHQARSFAAAVLIPKTTIKEALIQTQTDMGITPSKTGFIYLSDNSTHNKDFYETLRGLQAIYNVSKTALRYRLSKFDLILDHTNKVLSLKVIFEDMIQTKLI